MSDISTPVTIALCTYNGAAHLPAQLQSYLDQRDVDWRLWVSDDGSTDVTRDILKNFAQRHDTERDIRIVDGPRGGFCANFMSLLCHPDFPAGPVALSDQDDVWLPHKLARARDQMKGQTGPAIYGAQSLHVDSRLRPIGRSSTAGSLPSFGNALVQNIVSGHSCVLSDEALALVRSAGVPQGLPYHDWWLYMLITGAGGQATVDDETVLMYRQHGENLMGAHDGWQAKFTRARQVLGSEYGSWITANTRALTQCSDLLNAPARAVLADFLTPARGLARAAQLHRLGIKRQGRIGTACLYTAAALGHV
tara:strand:- start:123690 stop:124613 length:924 start_codon:yes stop_codon:yes gene_type:complete